MFFPLAGTCVAIQMLHGVCQQLFIAPTIASDQITGLINPTSQLNGSVCSSGEILKSDGLNFSCEKSKHHLPSGITSPLQHKFQQVESHQEQLEVE